jgi:hypothetical protein
MLQGEYNVPDAEERQEIDLFRKLSYWACCRTYGVAPDAIAQELHVDAATVALWERRYDHILRWLRDAAFLFHTNCLAEFAVHRLMTTPKGRACLAKDGLVVTDADGKERLHPEWWAPRNERPAIRPRKRKAAAKQDAAPQPPGSGITSRDAV